MNRCAAAPYWPAILLTCVFGCAGCSALPFPRGPLDSTNGANASADNSRTAGKQDKGDKQANQKPPAVLLQWALGPEKEDEDDEDQEQPLASDRPDFVEASINVGAGRVQLEMGYTFFRDRADGITTEQHSCPEALLRIGFLRDWLELRIGQNLASEQLTSGATRSRHHGAEDIYLGLGVGLTEQKGIFPESRIVLQMRVPTGSEEFTDRHVLPGANYLYGWDVIKDRLTLGASTQINLKHDDASHLYTELAQAVTTGISITDKLGMYLETFALFPAGAAVALPEYYADGGFIYGATKNLQFDIRAGVGLNRNADDFFAGSGVVVRY